MNDERPSIQKVYTTVQACTGVNSEVNPNLQILFCCIILVKVELMSY